MSKNPTLQARRFATEAELRAAILACRFIRKDGSDAKPWCVYSEAGERITCHETHEQAANQLAAIEANKESDKSARQETEPERQPQDEVPQTPTIKRTEDGWRVESDEGTVDVDTRAEAFEAIEATDWFSQVTRQKHVDQFEGLAEGRWLDAASVEDLPAAHDGSQIRDHAITQMADNLAREKTPVMVDGGNVSEVHESVWNTAAKAAGWVFAAVRVEGDDDKPHLWLWVRLKPDVDGAVDGRELQFGSIAFLEETSDRYTCDPIGARLISYALTNEPFVEGLEPHGPRGERSARTQPQIAVTRSRDIMSKTKPASRPHTDGSGEHPEEGNDVAQAFDSDDEAKKFATDELQWWREVTGEPELSPSGAADMRTSLTDTVKGALAKADSQQDGMPSEGDRSARAPDPSVRGPAMEALGKLAEMLNIDMQGEEARFQLTDTIHALFDAAAAEEVAESLGASSNPNPDQGDRDMSQTDNTNDKGGSGEAAAAQTPQRAEVEQAVTRAELDKIREENAQLRERLDRKEAEETVNRLASERQLTISDEVPEGKDISPRETLVRAVLTQGEDLVRDILDQRNAPPAGRATDPSSAQVRTGGDPTTQKEAVDRAKADIRKEEPGLRKHEVRTKGYERARRDYPHLFTE